MKLIITIPKNKYRYIQELEQDNTDYATTRMLYHAVKHGKPIPDNATNGDVIQILFPNICESFSNIFDLNLWWNAKYKAESEEISERNMKMWEDIFKAERGDKE